MTVTATTTETTERPKPKRRAFVPPPNGTGVPAVDAAFATAARISAEQVAASHAVDRAERAYTRAAAQNLDVKEAAAAMLAGEPAPPSTLERLRDEWDQAKRLLAATTEARSLARTAAREALEANRAAVVKVQRAKLAKAAARARPALEAVAGELDTIAEARGTLAFLDDPSMFRRVPAAVAIGRGELYGAAPFLAALADDLASDVG